MLLLLKRDELAPQSEIDAVRDIMETLQGNIIGELLRGSVELTNRLFRTLGLRELNCVCMRVRHVYIRTQFSPHWVSVDTFANCCNQWEGNQTVFVCVSLTRVYIQTQFSPQWVWTLLQTDSTSGKGIKLCSWACYCGLFCKPLYPVGRELNCVRVHVTDMCIYEHSLVHIESVWTLLQTVVASSGKGIKPLCTCACQCGFICKPVGPVCSCAVSYTHLTLPTSSYV